MHIDGTFRFVDEIGVRLLVKRMRGDGLRCDPPLRMECFDKEMIPFDEAHQAVVGCQGEPALCPALHDLCHVNGESGIEALEDRQCRVDCRIA